MRAGCRSRRGVAAVLAVAALTLTACQGDDSLTPEPSASGPNAATLSAPPIPPDLGQFYSQQLDWSACDGGFQCAELTVPVSYDEPAGATLRLSLVRLPAGQRGKRLGSLVINPGGPGASGVQYARQAKLVISAATRRAYDVVGFDPRGVGASDPLQCLTDAQTDEQLAQDPTPDDAAEADRAVALGKRLGAGCEAADPELAAHVGTADAARDLDVLRAALGDKRLTYLGKSYGTFLGATYAELFPKNVGRMVLDGAVDPSLTSEEFNLGQAEGFEQATRSFVADCVAQSTCPLGSSVDAGMQSLQQLLVALDHRPLPTGDPRTPLTEGWGSLGIAIAMYDTRLWSTLRRSLALAQDGNGAGLMQLAGLYARRNPDGSYQDNGNTVIYAINCLDRPTGGGVAAAEKAEQRFAQVAPTWGRLLAWSDLPCSTWPIRSDVEPHAIAAPGSPPIVVVGTTRDPATPYRWAQGLAAQLSDGHLVTYRGDGHTAYMQGDRCVDKHVDRYLLRGTVPPDDATC